jgi:integrase
MPRSKKPVPTYSHHKPTDQAYVRIPNGNGGRRVVYLGKFGSPESQAEYQRVLAELRAAPFAVLPATGSSHAVSNVTINEVLLAFMRWAATHYRTPAGEPTTEIHELKWSIKPVRELYGHIPAAEFGPLSLAAVREHMVGLKWCRTVINKRIDRVKRVFKWATSAELVPVTVYQALRTLSGLRQGRTQARESEPVTPANPIHVTATLPFLTPHLRAMVELQRLTGMRPGEICQLRFAEVDRTGTVWVYRPAQHKTAHHGKTRAIHFGPRARAVITGFLRRGNPIPDSFSHLEVNNPDHSNARRVMADAYQDAGRERDAALLRDVTRPVVLVEGCVVDPALPLFSPAESRAEWARAMRAKRRSKVPPSQQNRRATKPKKTPGTKYTVAAYGYAVRKAADKANVPHWHPNQLRHLFATEVRKVHGLEAAQVLLGHSRADVTQIYAERNEKLAVTTAAAIG